MLRILTLGKWDSGKWWWHARFVNKITRVRVMVFNATLNDISELYHGGQFYWWRKLDKKYNYNTIKNNIITKNKQCLYVNRTDGATVVMIVWYKNVVGYTTTYAISGYHHWRCEFEYRSDEVYSIQYYVIKVFFWFPPPIKPTAMI